MKKTLKILLAFMLITITLMSTTAFATEKYQAVEPTFEVLVNGEHFYSSPPIVVIDGRTYLPLRALGECLGIYVEWDATLGQVEVSSTKEAIPPYKVDNAYEKFSDVPDFGKVTGLKPFAEQEDTSVFGYAVSIGYQTNPKDMSAAIDKYIATLAENSYELWYEGKSGNYNASLYLKKDTGRMVNVLARSDEVVITILKKPRSEEEWILLDAGKTLPQKKFDAVTAGFKVMVDGTEFVSENPAMVINDRTYLPLRAMGDALGVFVDWDAENQTVIVNSKK